MSQSDAGRSGADQWSQSPNQNITPVGGAPAPSRSRSRAVPVVAGIAGAAVVLGAAGALAAQRLSPQAGDPEDILPASTMAFVKVDLDPSIGQKVAYLRMRDLIAKDEKDVAGAKEPADLVCKAFLKKLDCEADVKPWLGDRFAMAAWPSGNTDSPLRGVVVLKVKDAEKAKAAAQKEYPSAVVKDDFLVLDADEETPSAGSLEADTKAAGTLAEKTEYKDDVAKLDLDSVANLWVDLKPLVKLANDHQEKSAGADKPASAPSLTDDALSKFTEDAAGLGGTGVDPLAGWDSARMEKVSGRFVGGVSLKDDGVKMRFVTLDVTDGTNTVKDLYSKLKPGIDSIGNLPGDAQAALGVSGLGDALVHVFENPKDAGLSDADVASIKKDLAEIGISVPGDFPKLLGSQTAMSLTMSSQDTGSATLRLTDADDATVAKLVERGKQELAGDSSAPTIAQTRDGDTTTVTFSLQGQPGAGLLKDNPKFTRALPDLANANVALFVDLAGLGAKVNEPDLADAGYLGLTGTYDVEKNTSTMDVDWVLE